MILRSGTNDQRRHHLDFIPFTDLIGNKNRPALVLVDGIEDVTVCFLTTQLRFQSQFDIEISPSSINGLKKTSLIRIAKIATIEKGLALGKLGIITSRQMSMLDRNLKGLFKINC